MVKKVGSGITGDVNIRPAVVIVIGDGRCKGIMAGRAGNTALFRDVGEGSVAVIPVENVLSREVRT